jgi:hypothetical protein
MHYKNWIIVPLEELLREDDHYWFKEGTYDVQGNDTKA